MASLGNTYYEIGDRDKGISLMKKALIALDTIDDQNQKLVLHKLKEWGVLGE